LLNFKSIANLFISVDYRRGEDARQSLPSRCIFDGREIHQIDF
jgi:hypothetical protein